MCFFCYCHCLINGSIMYECFCGGNINFPSYQQCVSNAKAKFKPDNQYGGWNYKKNYTFSCPSGETFAQYCPEEIYYEDTHKGLSYYTKEEIAELTHIQCIPKPTATPKLTPGITPKETPGNTPGITPKETPAKTLALTPKDTPIRSPNQTPNQTPEITPIRTPIRTLALTPKETPIKTLALTPKDTPIRSLIRTPFLTPPSYFAFIEETKPDNLPYYLSAAAGTLSLVIIFLVIFWCCRRKKTTGSESEPEIIESEPRDPITIILDSYDPFAHDFEVSDSYFEGENQ